MSSKSTGSWFLMADVAHMIMQTTAAMLPSRGLIIYSAAHAKSEQITKRTNLQEKKANTMLAEKENEMKQFCSLHNS